MVNSNILNVINVQLLESMSFPEMGVVIIFS